MTVRILPLFSEINFIEFSFMVVGGEIVWLFEAILCSFYSRNENCRNVYKSCVQKYS